MLQNEYSLGLAAVKHLFITIDPSAAKGRNHYVLSSMIFVNDICVVCPSPTRHVDPLCCCALPHLSIMLCAWPFTLAQ